jgi:hypothetical protein
MRDLTGGGETPNDAPPRFGGGPSRGRGLTACFRRQVVRGPDLLHEPQRARGGEREKERERETETGRESHKGGGGEGGPSEKVELLPSAIVVVGGECGDLEYHGPIGGHYSSPASHLSPPAVMILLLLPLSDLATIASYITITIIIIIIIIIIIQSIIIIMTFRRCLSVTRV